MTERKAVIKNADMSEDMQQDAVDSASQALEKFNIEKVHILCDYCTIFYSIKLKQREKLLRKPLLGSNVIFIPLYINDMGNLALDIAVKNILKSL